MKRPAPRTRDRKDLAWERRCDLDEPVDTDMALAWTINSREPTIVRINQRTGEVTITPMEGMRDVQADPS